MNERRRRDTLMFTERFPSDSEIYTTLKINHQIIISSHKRILQPETNAIKYNYRIYFFILLIDLFRFHFAFADTWLMIEGKNNGKTAMMSFDRCMIVGLIRSILKLALMIAIRSSTGKWKTIDRHSRDKFFNQCFLWYTSFWHYVFSYTLAANASDIVQADRINAHFPRSTLAFRCCRGCNSRLTSWRNSVHSFATQTLCNPVSKFRRVDASSSDNGATRATWRDCD